MELTIEELELCCDGLRALFEWVDDDKRTEKTDEAEKLYDKLNEQINALMKWGMNDAGNRGIRPAFA